MSREPRPPHFQELFEEPLPDDERSRFEQAHDLIVEAGPPPEVPPWLEQPPSPWEEEESNMFSRPRTAAAFTRRRRMRTRTYAMLSFAAALAVLAFFVGYTASGDHGTFSSKFKIPMMPTAVSGTNGAAAVILVADRDSAGNWPMLLRVEGLRQLPEDSYYELFLTRHGKPVATCGTFRVHAGVTDVRLNAPYNFRKFTGWVVTRHDSNQVVLRTKTV